MGSFSFGISEIIKAPVEGWFKLLSEEEGEFYNVPVSDGIDTEVFRKQIRQKASVISTHKPAKVPSEFDREIPHNMSRKDIIRSTDFNFLMVLGKGSFGKVFTTVLILRVAFLSSQKKAPFLNMLNYIIIYFFLHLFYFVAILSCLFCRLFLYFLN